jgi:hypothetical protein
MLRHDHRRLLPHAVPCRPRGLLELAARTVRPLFLGSTALRQGTSPVRPLKTVALLDCYVSAHPNAGLPNAFGGYDETADMLADEIESWATSGIVNIVGGCCGTSPEHIAAIAQRVAAVNPRRIPEIAPALRLSGLEPFNVTHDSLYVNVGERTNVTGSRAFARMILEGRFDDALAVARQQVENGAQVIDINMDERCRRGRAMTRFLNLIAASRTSPVPIMLDSPSGRSSRPDSSASGKGSPSIRSR